MHNFPLKKHELSGLTIYCSEKLSCEKVLGILHEDGTILKTSPKYETKQIGQWVLKSSNQHAFHGLIRHCFAEQRPQTLFKIVDRLQKNGITSPQLVAIVIWRYFRLGWRRTVITEYLSDVRTVEQYLREILREKPEDVGPFFHELQSIIQRLFSSGLYHEDLSGKNILTANGKDFYLVDLEAVRLHYIPTKGKLVRNLVQLYDSFCDMVDDEHLLPFICGLLPPGLPKERYFALIKEKQKKRRSKHLHKVSKQH